MASPKRSRGARDSWLVESEKVSNKKPRAKHVPWLYPLKKGEDYLFEDALI